MINNDIHICEKCGKEFIGDWRKDKKSRKQPLRFCSRACSNTHTPSQEHREKTRASVKKFWMKQTKRTRRAGYHTRNYYTKPMSMRNGVVLNVTREFVDKYRKEHPVCEICGKRVEEVVKTKSKFGPHSLCIDHDHNTMKFRGILCSSCNRQLGWYEKNKDSINKYLNKGPVV